MRALLNITDWIKKLEMGSVFVTNIEKLKERLKELKLEKRELILAGKKTGEVDEKIELIESEISEFR